MSDQKPVEPAQKQNNTIDLNCSCPYPLDFWFEISRYIAPEDVDRFARICKHCTTIVKSTSFWLSLYRRYYKPKIPLPQSLQPVSLTQRDGLRARVIRALYFLYTPMTRKLQDSSIKAARLLNRMCVYQSHKYHFAIGCATFIFKFQDVRCIPIRGQETGEKADDVNANKDEGAITLKLTCSQITNPPLVLIGRVLRSISLPTTADPGGHVHISVADNMVAKPVKINVVISKVIAVQMTDWWHPCFTHTHPFQSILHPCYTDSDRLTC